MSRPLAAAVALVLAASAGAVQAQWSGLRTDPDPRAARSQGPQWQARIQHGMVPGDAPLRVRPLSSPMWLWPTQDQALSLLGDMQFDTLRLGDTGGLRLTGGVLLNLRGADRTGLQGPRGGLPLGTLSGTGFAGVGYAIGSADGAFGFSADLGLTGLDFGSADRARSEPVWRLGEWRMSPLVRMGLRLAF